MPAPVTVDAHCGSFGSGVLAASSSRTSSLGSSDLAGSVVAVEGLGDEVVQEDGEHDADAGLVAERGGEVERVGVRRGASRG